MTPRMREWGRAHSVGLVIAAAVVYAAGIVGAFLFASSAVQREADRRVADAEAQDAEIAVRLARSACQARNSFRDALDEVFDRLDELLAEGGGDVRLAVLFADLVEHENCAAIDTDFGEEP